MNRRNFISKSSLALFAAAGLPKAVFNKPTIATIYKTELQSGITNQTYYELTIDHDAVWDLEKSTSAAKIVTLTVSYYETDILKPTKTAEFRYIIQECVQVSKANDTWLIKTKLDKKVSGDYKQSKDFPKDMTLSGKPNSHFDIIGKKDQVLMHIPYPTSASSGSGDYDGCFLTTACVEHKQLADDCDELTTLRFLRDTYMKQDAEGSVLVKDYKIIGPQIVRSIDRFENKAEIYNYMYDHLVDPSVKLIKAKRYAEATNYYKDFVEGLMKKYL